jgi:excisionase family DNA binding protein
MRHELNGRPENSESRAHRENRSTYQSVGALAADLGLSERSTRSALRRGEIPHIRVGRRFILPRAAIAEWLRTAGQKPESEQMATQVGQRAALVAFSRPAEVPVMTRISGRP